MAVFHFGKGKMFIRIVRTEVCVTSEQSSLKQKKNRDCHVKPRTNGIPKSLVS